MAKYDITPKATDDLYHIWEYTADTWSEKQADAYYNILCAAMDEIAAAPQTTGRPYDEIIPGIRACHVRKHMVFFIVQANGRALIVRILYERMDYRRHL